jgi:hypothetical protein
MKPIHKKKIKNTLLLSALLFCILLSCNQSGKGDDQNKDDDFGGGDNSAFDDSEDDLFDDTEGDDSTVDDTAVDDDLLPGTTGWATTTSLDIYRFKNQKIESNYTHSFGETGIIEFIVSNDDAVYFAVHEVETATLWRYDGTWDDLFSYDSSGDECTIHFTSIAAWGSGSSDFLILSYCNDADPDSEDFQYYPSDPGVTPFGLFAGFYGGAYPYDETTIYSYDGSTATPLATVPESQILQAKPWGGDGFTVVTAIGSVWAWDHEAEWVKLADSIPFDEADMLMTDPERDVLFGDFIDGNPDAWEYSIIENGNVSLYTAFDTSTCCNHSAALLAGTGKAFWCQDKPADVTCEETDGNASYFITEMDGAISCQGVSIGNSPWMSLLWVQW